MSELNREIGGLIRNYRKAKNLTQDELSEKICKSKSTISKYEKGEIAVDIETLYEIADAIGVHVEQLLSQRSFERKEMQNEFCPAFFRGRNRFYGYIFDGRSNQLIRCVFDLLSKDERNRDKVMMYMNFKDYAHYQKCENTYWGYMEHYNAVTNIHLVNQDSPMEKASAQLLASYLDSDTKWGLFNGFSSRPMMPSSSASTASTSPRYCWGSSASRSKESPPFTAMHSLPFSAVSTAGVPSLGVSSASSTYSAIAR